MKKALSLLSFLLTITLCALCFSACMNGIREFRSGDYRYTVENDKVTITQYTGNDAEVTVPGEASRVCRLLQLTVLHFTIAII